MAVKVGWVIFEGTNVRDAAIRAGCVVAIEESTEPGGPTKMKWHLSNGEIFEADTESTLQQLLNKVDYAAGRRRSPS